MADHFYISCWLRGFNEHNALAHFQKTLTRFPFSRLAPGATLRVYAIEHIEPPLVERIFDQEFDVSELIAAAREFQNADCAYEVETHWDLLRPVGGEWKLQPAKVAITCFSPEFDSELGEQLRVEFGADAPFVPEPESNLVAVRSNIRSLLHLANDIKSTLPVQRLSIWSDSGDDLAAQLEQAVEEAL